MAPYYSARAVAIAIFAVAFALRLLHIVQIRPAPFFSLLMGDSRSYDAWAQRIAAGDWIGRDVFYQAPLYPYFLGVVYSLIGRDLLLVRIIQAAIGSVSCVLLASAARRLFNDAAGIVAGLLLALWAPAIFFDGLLQKSVLDVFFVCLMIWLITGLGRSGGGPSERKREKPERGIGRRWLALGLAVGGLSLTRENALVFVVILLAWALLSPSRWRAAALFAAGMAIVLVPVAVRNSALGGGFYVTTSQFGPNFYIGNNARADGTYASLRYGRGAPEYEREDATQLAERALGRRLSPAEVSSYWTDQALAFITSHPVNWLKLVGRKITLLWNATEMVDTESQETYAEWSWPLRVLGPLTHFGVLAPLALMGVLLTWRSRADVNPLPSLLLMMTIGYAASVVLFYVFARYRYPLVPFLILFASAGIVLLAAQLAAFFTASPRGELRSRPVSRATLGLGLAAVVFAVWANWPVIPANWMRAVSESNIGVALQAEQRYDEAIQHYERAIGYRPDLAPALNNLATAYRASGRTRDAVAAYRRALKVQPDFPDAEYNLANALLEEGAAGEAIDRFETALRSIPDSADIHNNLGTALAETGRADDAAREFRRALQFDPDSATAHRNLGDLLAAQGDRAGALEHLRLAVRADPASGEAHYDLGLVLLEGNALDEAAAEFRAAIEQQPTSAEAHNNLGIVLGSQGKIEEAIAQFREALRLRPDLADAKKNLEMASAAKRQLKVR